MNILLNSFAQRICVSSNGRYAIMALIKNKHNLSIRVLNKGVITNIHHNAIINHRKYPATGK